MIFYLDASVIVKRYIEEPGSSEVNTMLSEAEAVGTNIISGAEVAAGIMRASRLGIFDSGQAPRVLEAFRSEWERYIRLPVSEATVLRAGDLVRNYDLRAHDAVHMAATILWQEAMGQSISMATYDRSLWRSCKAFGLGVWPSNLQ